MERALRDKLLGGTFGDVPATHSRRMGAIRGKGNKTTEARFRAVLVRAGVRGWRMNNKELPGTPDFFFSKQRIAVFLDGCYWHGCARCGHIPTVNRSFWKAKIERNQERDRASTARLKADGIRVLRFWEHELLEDAAGCVHQLLVLISSRARTLGRASERPR